MKIYGAQGRIHKEEKFQVHSRGGRKRALGTRKPIVLPEGPSQRWNLDIMSDAFTDGRRLRVLAAAKSLAAPS